MDESYLLGSGLECAALTINAALLVLMTLAMSFPERINRLGARLSGGGAVSGFFPVASSVAVERWPFHTP